MSYWQWTRHLEKKEHIATLQTRLTRPPVELETLLREVGDNWQSAIHRRVLIEGTYDFEHEMVIRNRRNNNLPGVHIMTPLLTANSDHAVLVNRGFVPLQYSEKDSRKSIRKPNPVRIVGLLKESNAREMFSPRDPSAGPNLPWVDAWLRVDISEMQKQIPYPVLPIYAEEIPGGEKTDLSKSMIAKGSEKADIFMPKTDIYGMVATETGLTPSAYPIPEVDTVIPAGRHLGYVFEWAALAFLAAAIAVILQLRPPKHAA